jgi:hypothetical protein
MPGVAALTPAWEKRKWSVTIGDSRRIFIKRKIACSLL